MAFQNLFPNNMVLSPFLTQLRSTRRPQSGEAGSETVGGRKREAFLFLSEEFPLLETGWAVSSKRSSPMVEDSKPITLEATRGQQCDEARAVPSLGGTKLGKGGAVRENVLGGEKGLGEKRVVKGGLGGEGTEGGILREASDLGKGGEKGLGEKRVEKGGLGGEVAEGGILREGSDLGKGGVVRENGLGGEKGLGEERVEEGGLGGEGYVKVEYSGLLRRN